MKIEMKKCVTAEEIMTTFDVMKQLRQEIKQEEYVGMINHLMKNDNYHLIGVYAADGKCVGAAGIRYKHSLFRNGKRELYVDDLVTDKELRSKGIGHEMMVWLKAECKKENCVGVVLDSGLSRVDAHRFYKREGMEPTAFHFYRPKSPGPKKEDVVAAAAAAPQAVAPQAAATQPARAQL